MRQGPIKSCSRALVRITVATAGGTAAVKDDDDEYEEDVRAAAGVDTLLEG